MIAYNILHIFNEVHRVDVKRVERYPAHFHRVLRLVGMHF